MLNKADATRLRLLVAIKSRALTLVSASGASVVDVLLMQWDKTRFLEWRYNW